MKVIISSTFDDNYLWNIPLVTWSWNRVGVDVICYLPLRTIPHSNGEKFNLIQTTLDKISARCQFRVFDCPPHKEATYAQVSRLYAAASHELDGDEILITSDVDMSVFSDYVKTKNASFDIFGHDLTPKTQYPLCYISASVKDWRYAMSTNGRSIQQCLDETVGIIECENFRGNQWSLDQDLAYKLISKVNDKYLHGRAREGTQFASNRLDRDDAYILDRINPNIIDFHLPRPGYAENNFSIILKVMQEMYPYDNFDWLIEYNNSYKQLL